MSLKKIQQVKKDKGFKICDLFVYGAILLIVAVLFIVIFTTKDTSPLSGVKIYVDNVSVFEYDFTKNEYSIPQTQTQVEVSEANENGQGVLTVTVFAGGGKNVVKINKAEFKVWVSEADCGKADCVYTPAITDNSGIIFCSPHRLRIVPFNFQPDDIIII